MKHLTREELQDYIAGRDARLDQHLAGCGRCQRELSIERRITAGLARMERFSPSPAFAVKLDRALAHVESSRAARAPTAAQPSFAWTAIAAALASSLLLLFALQTAVALREDGALDFVSLYASRPDLLSTYPAESVSALLESLPIAQLALTAGLLVIALVLTQQFLLARTSMARFSRPQH